MKVSKTRPLVLLKKGIVNVKMNYVARVEWYWERKPTQVDVPGDELLTVAVGPPENTFLYLTFPCNQQSIALFEVYEGSAKC